MKKIILDTNFLLIPSQFKVDIFEEIRRIASFPYQLVIIDRTVDELKRIVDLQSRVQQRHARIALEMIKRYPISLLPTAKDKDVDSLILRQVDKDCIVATQDINLKRKLREKGIPIIFLRQKRYLEMK